MALPNCQSVRQSAPRRACTLGAGAQELPAAAKLGLLAGQRRRPAGEAGPPGRCGEQGVKNRWCAVCAKAHAGAVDTSNKMCEECHKVQPNFGLISEGLRRWCVKCAKGHAGAVDIISKMCEGCNIKHPRYRLLSDGKRGRWCLKCSKAHPRAVDVVNAKCEVCKLKQPSFGLLADGKIRWCATCASAHPAWGAARIPPKSGFKKSKVKFTELTQNSEVDPAV